jgi:hypothetical protein
MFKLKPMAMLPHVLPIIPKPISVVLNRFEVASLSVTLDPSPVAVEVIAVLPDCVYIAIKPVVVAGTKTFAGDDLV